MKGPGEFVSACNFMVFKLSVSFLVGCWRALTQVVVVGGAAVALMGGCAHTGPAAKKPPFSEVRALTVEGPVELKLKAESGRLEKVAFSHRLVSQSYEGHEIRHRKEETLEFVSQAETLSIEPESGRFTQVITVTHKDGVADLHEFAMPEVGERLEVIADNQGRIYKAGEYPPDSIFYVPPVSLPKGPVELGDTWTMQGRWLSLDEQVPFQLDMVSILKGVWKCGNDRCAEIEVSGEVKLQNSFNLGMDFKSFWKGRLYFAIDAGTVVWSRVESEERFLAPNVRRDINSCLEAQLIEPKELKMAKADKPSCSSP